ncbi:BspA family leucine-rich repeat surface protein, partial [bacterium]|nr:BspA family leucine-rich repeat surface protein [bacterium]
MVAMFQYARAFNKNIGNWDVSKVANMAAMFSGIWVARNPFNQNLANWNTSNVTHMGYMFSDSAFDQNIGSWNVTNVVDMTGMFQAVYNPAPAVKLSRENYDAILLGWSIQNIKTSVPFHAGATKYSLSAAVVAARAALSPGKSWTITDGGGQAVAPGAPTGVSGTSGNTQVSLSWTAPSDTGGALITDYAIQYSSNGGPWINFTDGVSTNTTAVVTGLSNGTEYIFQVAAINSAGTGAYAQTAIGITPATTPDTPTGVSGTAGNGQVSLSWTAPAVNGGSTITDYVIQVKPSSGGAWTTFSDGTSTNTTATVTGLTPQTAYIFQVAAVNAAGQGSYSASSTSVTPYTTPGAPSGVSAASGNTQVLLSWTAPTDNGGALITDYSIQYKSGSGAWITFSEGVSPSTSTVVTGLANGTEYTFQVAAVNAAGTGTYSASSLGVTPATTPNAPTSVTGTAGDEQVSLSWTAPLSNGGSAITGYKVEYQLATGGGWTVFSDNASTSTTLTVTGLTNNTSYIFRVAAKNAAGVGSYSESSSAVTPQPAFVSTWKTDNTSTGSSASNQITLPLESTGTYNFTVDWGDGTSNTITSGTDANRTHTYATAGTYTVTINGTITGFRFENPGDRQKITNISKFGSLRLGNNGSYFDSANNLTITATDALDLTGTTNLSSAFTGCTSLTTAPSMASWDT